MSPISRGVAPSRAPDADPSRVRRLAVLTGDFPVLSAADTPHPRWRMERYDPWRGRRARVLSWEEFAALPFETITTYISCRDRVKGSTHRGKACRVPLSGGGAKARRVIVTGLVGWRYTTTCR